MKVILQSEGQDAFLLEADEDNFYLLDRKVMKRFGPAPELRFTRHGLWVPFSGSSQQVLDLFERAAPVPLNIGDS